jgi:hypothetical protein
MARHLLLSLLAGVYEIYGYRHDITRDETRKLKPRYMLGRTVPHWLRTKGKA